MSITPVFVRHEYLLDPDTPLLLPGGSASLVQDWDAFAEDTGIPLEDCVTTPVLALPVPLPGAVVRDSLNLDALALPWLWRPERLALPVEGESFDHWTLRIGFEAVLNGLVDPETGQWLDALGAAGLDPEDGDSHRRAAAHLLGEPDQLVAGIPDLLWPGANAAPAGELADAFEVIHPQVAWGLAIDDLLEFLTAVQGDAMTTRDLAAAVDWAAGIAERVLDRMPQVDAGQPRLPAIMQAVARQADAGWRRYQLAQVTAVGGPWEFLLKTLREASEALAPARRVLEETLGELTGGQRAIAAGGER